MQLNVVNVVEDKTPVNQQAAAPIDSTKLLELETLLREVKREQQNTTILLSALQVEIKEKVDNVTFNINLNKKMDKGLLFPLSIPILTAPLIYPRRADEDAECYEFQRRQDEEAPT